MVVGNFYLLFLFLTHSLYDLLLEIYVLDICPPEARPVLDQGAAQRLGDVL